MLGTHIRYDVRLPSVALRISLYVSNNEKNVKNKMGHYYLGMLYDKFSKTKKNKYEKVNTFIRNNYNPNCQL